jgi:hypothetical protein
MIGTVITIVWACVCAITIFTAGFAVGYYYSIVELAKKEEK